jgi:glutaredoxin 3
MQDFINGEVSSNKVVVFSKTYCPYCKATKELFKKPEFSGITPVYHELDKRDDGLPIQKTLLQMSGQRTVPSVWIGGKFVGGNSDAQDLYKSGELLTMLGLN